MIAGVLRRITIRGGPGSGHFGHAGRPGEVGGSAPSGGTEGDRPIDHHNRYLDSYRAGARARFEGRDVAGVARRAADLLEHTDTQDLSDYQRSGLAGVIEALRRDEASRPAYTAAWLAAVSNYLPDPRLAELLDRHGDRGDELLASDLIYDHMRGIDVASNISRNYENRDAVLSHLQEEARSLGNLGRSVSAAAEGGRGRSQEISNRIEGQRSEMERLWSEIAVAEHQLYDDDPTNDEAASARADELNTAMGAAGRTLRELQLDRIEARSADAADAIGASIARAGGEVAGDALRMRILTTEMPDVDRPRSEVFSTDQAYRMNESVETARAWLASSIAASNAEALEVPIIQADERTADGREYMAGRDVAVFPDTTSTTVIHEFGHWMEAVNPAIHDAAVGFLVSRIGEEEARPLSEIAPDRQWMDGERAVADNFSDPYMGKVYSGSDHLYRATEIVSMGLQSMYTDPAEFARTDPEYFRFTLALMRGDFSGAPTVTRGRLRRIIIRGGPGSGHFGHEGRPGEVGGSQPGEGTVHVGITGARPGEPARETVAEMADFQRRLGSLPGVSDVHIATGIGAWQGGQEVTWVTSYRGNGEALAAIAQTAEAEDQDAALIISERGPGDPSVMGDVLFQTSLGIDGRRAVESVLADRGISGWTWYRRPEGGVGLRLVSVPRWGGSVDSHRESVGAVRASLNSAGLRHDYVETQVNVLAMEREGAHAFGTFARGQAAPYTEEGHGRHPH